MKFKVQFSIFLIACLFMLSGCFSAIDNQTPRTFPQNPSNSYRIAMRVRNSNVDVTPGSYRSVVVIDGERHDMIKTGNADFYFDYKIQDKDKHAADYRYEVSYEIGKKTRNITSKDFKLNIINRYVVGFECNRGKPYSKISLLGRGFSNGDCVVIGEYACDTVFISPNVLEFTVPLIEGGRPYKAVLDSENGDIGLGEFFVDTLAITPSPREIALMPGDKQVLTFSIDVPAPTNGLPLDITTDVPDSVIMHDVMIQPGMCSARVVIEGGKPGKGALFIAAPGFSECVVPIRVEGIDAEPAFLGNSDLTDLGDDVILEE